EAIENGGKHVAALFIGAQQERALTVSSPDRRDSRIHQLKLRRIERVLYRKNGSQYSEQEEYQGDCGRNHGEPRATKRIEHVALDGASKPAPPKEAPALRAGFGL